VKTNRGRAGRPPGCSGHRIWGQATRHHRHGADRPGSGAAAPAPFGNCRSITTNRRRVPAKIEEELTGDVLGESRSDARPPWDIISVNCPHTPATFHLLSARAAQAHPGRRPYIVNTARAGEVIDEKRAGAPDRPRATSPAPDSTFFEHEPAGQSENWSSSRASARFVLLPPYGLGHARRSRRHGGKGEFVNIKTFLDGPSALPTACLPSIAVR